MDSLQEPTGPPHKAAIPCSCWQNTEWVTVAACYLFLRLGQVYIETSFLSKLNQLSVGSFSRVFVKFRGSSNYVRS